MSTIKSFERSTFEVSFFLNRSKIKKKTGKAPIVVRITINGDQAHLNAKLDILPDQWDVKLNAAKKRSEAAELINPALNAISTKLTNDYFFLLNRDRVVTAESLKNCFLGIDVKNTTLLQAFDEYIKERDERVKKGKLSYSTFKKDVRTRRRIVDFMRLKRKGMKDILLASVGIDFYNDFVTYMELDEKLDNNTLLKDARILKKMLTDAHLSGIISKHPFPNSSVKRIEKEREVLTLTEINKIMSLDFSEYKDNSIERVRDAFIFSCFTGLSYTDLHSLSQAEINETGDLFLVYKRNKTNQIAKVPHFSSIPLMILKKYEGKLNPGKLLPCLSNTNMNSYLKLILTKAEINKRITYHDARHTFGTTVTYEQGATLESVSGMMGHKSIKTTRIYAKMTAKKILNESTVLIGKFKEQEAIFSKSVGA